MKTKPRIRWMGPWCTWIASSDDDLIWEITHKINHLNADFRNQMISRRLREFWE